MPKNQEKSKTDFMDKGSEITEEKIDKDETDQPQMWMCVTQCFCSDNGNPLRARRWVPGDSVFSKKRPSIHFVSKNEYETGAGGRQEYLEKFANFGGQVTDQVRNLQLHVLKAWVVEQEKAYLRRQAQTS